MVRKVFGKQPAGERKARIATSAHYRNGAFQNIEPTAVTPKNVSMWKMLRDFGNKPKTVVPGNPLPVLQTDLVRLPAEKPTVVWFGHSSYFIKSKDFNLLVDPVLSGHASPVRFFGKSFEASHRYGTDDFPDIDLLLITHDHYDHLDFETITRLHPKVKRIITPLGVGAHLEHWGVEKSKITELDWWDSETLRADVEVTATPARHFSGRGLARGKALWASYVLRLHGYQLFLGGDSGYDKQFQIIGDKFGPFDLALLECGQYGEGWPQIHMQPEETVQAAKDLRARVLLPVHWAKFALALHPWDEPIRRLATAAQQEQQPFVTPRLGQPYMLGEKLLQPPWWEFV